MTAPSDKERTGSLARSAATRESSTPGERGGRYELRFIGLFDRGRGYAFPCDAAGQVELDRLTDRGRNNYFYARALVGQEVSPPVVIAVD